MFGGALLGLALRHILPEDHLSDETKDTVKLGMGVVATMAALVLGPLIASAKESYYSENRAVTQMAANFMLVDRLLAHYGSETPEARDRLRGAVVLFLDRIWPQNAREPVQLEPIANAEGFFDQIASLNPRLTPSGPFETVFCSSAATSDRRTGYSWNRRRFRFPQRFWRS